MMDKKVSVFCVLVFYVSRVISDVRCRGSI